MFSLIALKPWLDHGDLKYKAIPQNVLVGSASNYFCKSTLSKLNFPSTWFTST